MIFTQPKVVVIFGSDGEVGAAAARHMADRGFKLVLCARSMESLRALAADLPPQAEAVTRVADVSVFEEVAAVIMCAVYDFGWIDAVVYAEGAPLTGARAVARSVTADADLAGVLHAIAAAIPVFEDQDGGQLIHVARQDADVPRTPAEVWRVLLRRAFSERLLSEVASTVCLSSILEDFLHVDCISGDSVTRRQSVTNMVDSSSESIADIVHYAIERAPAASAGKTIVCYSIATPNVQRSRERSDTDT